MSDTIPQCYVCKNYPCKWFTDEERKEINTNIEICKHYEFDTSFSKDFDVKE